MTKGAKLSIGTLLLLGPIWVGSYFTNSLPVDHWAVMPIVMTCGLLVAFACVVFASLMEREV